MSDEQRCGHDDYGSKQLAHPERGPDVIRTVTDQGISESENGSALDCGYRKGCRTVSEDLEQDHDHVVEGLEDDERREQAYAVNPLLESGWVGDTVNSEEELWDQQCDDHYGSRCRYLVPGGDGSNHAHPGHVLRTVKCSADGLQCLGNTGNEDGR